MKPPQQTTNCSDQPSHGRQYQWQLADDQGGKLPPGSMLFEVFQRIRFLIGGKRHVNLHLARPIYTVTTTILSALIGFSGRCLTASRPPVSEARSEAHCWLKEESQSLSIEASCALTRVIRSDSTTLVVRLPPLPLRDGASRNVSGPANARPDYFPCLPCSWARFARMAS